MKEKALFVFLLISMIASAVVMASVVSTIESVRYRLSDDSPGAFNYLVQSEHNLVMFEDSLLAFNVDRNNAELRPQLIKDYIRHFDVLWGGLQVFDLRFAAGETQRQSELFINRAQEFLETNESLMVPDYVLSMAEIAQLTKEIKQLSTQVWELSRTYFIHASNVRDEWNSKLHRMYGLFWTFAAVLAITASLLIGSLVRSNARKNAMVKEAEDAREELAETVSELRSGKREQKSKDSFIAAASHDLRQPLHALGLFLSSLDNHVHSKDGRLALNEAAQCTNALSRLFNSLLDLSKLDAGVVQASIEDFELSKLLLMLRQEFVGKALEAGVTIELDAAPGMVRCDPLLLSRIVRNLLENALLHSGATVLHIRCMPSVEGMLLSISDNGNGIPFEEQSEVFSEYYQLDNPERDRSKGLGLGLSIVKRLAELLDVKVSLDSSPDSHTTFKLIVPLGVTQLVAEDTAELLPAKAVVSATHALVAVIDDDEKIRCGMEVMLRNMNIRPVTAESADELLRLLKSCNQQPDLIVADYRLRKGQTGASAITQVRHAFGVEIASMIITGDTSPARVADAASSGFELLHKPVDPKELLALITAMLHANRDADTPTGKLERV